MGGKFQKITREKTMNTELKPNDTQVKTVTINRLFLLERRCRDVKKVCPDVETRRKLTHWGKLLNKLINEDKDVLIKYFDNLEKQHSDKTKPCSICFSDCTFPNGCECACHINHANKGQELMTTNVN